MKVYTVWIICNIYNTTHVLAEQKCRHCFIFLFIKGVGLLRVECKKEIKIKRHLELLTHDCLCLTKNINEKNIKKNH